MPSSGSSAIRIVEAATTTKPFAVSPDSFNEAQEIGDRFKTGQPVIVNLQGVDKDLRRRLVDFASGLCYALAGKMDRVADQVYLLTPADVEVSHDDTRRAFD
jgi:cell division inhibitor SepF